MSRLRLRGGAPAAARVRRAATEEPPLSERGGAGEDAGVARMTGARPAVPGGGLGKRTRKPRGAEAGPGSGERARGRSLSDGGPGWKNLGCVEEGIPRGAN